MTVRLVTSHREFIGLASDVKPTDCPPGSRFFEADTPAWYRFDGTTWYAE